VADAVRRVGAAAARADGTAVAYVMAVVNSVLAVASAFGENITAAQSATIIGLANALMVAALHLIRHHEKNGQKNGQEGTT
jgi:hypothetical protein